MAVTQIDTSDTRLHLVASVERYRQLAKELPHREDRVVEIGASTGRTTAILAENAGSVVAVEIGEQFVLKAERSLQTLRNVDLLRMDAFDIGRVLSAAPFADTVFIDVGGDAPVEITIALARIYRAIYGPREMVIRSITLCGIMNAVATCEPMSKARMADIESLPEIAEGAQPFVRGLSASSEPSVRRAAARALKNEATLDSISCLVRLLDDPWDRVAKEAQKSLMKMGPEIASELQAALHADGVGDKAKKAIAKILHSSRFRTMRQ